MKKLTLTLSFLLISLFIFAQDVDIEFFKNGFSSPVDIQNAGDDRLFIVELSGIIKILNSDATINPTPFLNISSLIESGGEQGLLGLAFHPDYANNGYFFVYYTDNSEDTQVARYTVDGSDPDIADPSSALLIIDAVQPYWNHNGGSLQFGTDGYLYIGLGDGGSGGDPENRAQNLETLLGKILRIDIDNTEGGNNYAIPADNPFVGDPNAFDEIWAYGLRNPWRFSFDFDTDEIWIGDVGQGSIEEIDRAASDAAGLNYGWRCYEGTQTYNTSGCPDPSELTFPVAEYSHSGGNCSITGGYVYRGSIYSDIYGLYFYADYCSGDIGTVDAANNQINHGSFSGYWSTFGEDSSGEIYIADLYGTIYKIIGGELFDTEDFNKTDVSLIPNPASDSLQVSINNNLISSITILDLKGSVVLSERNLSTSEKTISISSLKSGVYLVKIISESGKSIIEKLVII